MTSHAIHSQQLENVLPAKWYVIQTQLKQEMTAKVNLTRQGFEVFLPQYIKKGKKADLILPLFSGYLFCQFDPTACRWQSIHSTIGVSRILGYDAGTTVPMHVRDNIIPGLQAFCDPITQIVDMQRAYPMCSASYSQGEAVKILKGMFEGQTATYWNSTKNGAMIILSLLNRPVRVILRNEEITRS